MLLFSIKDTGQQHLNSSYAMHYHWINWRIIGIHPPHKHRWLYNFYAVLVNLLFGIGLPCSLIANLFYIEGAEKIIGNLYLSVSIAMATGKQYALYYFRDRLHDVDASMAPLDARCNAHAVDRGHVLAGIRSCHRFYLAYMFCYAFCTLGFAYIAITERQPVYDGWFPQFFANPHYNLAVVLIYQNYAILGFFLMQNSNNDTYAPCYIVLMIAHLRALATRIGRIGVSMESNQEVNFKELRACIEDHKNILRFYQLWRPIVSTTLFMQFLITAMVLVLTAIKIIAFDREGAQMLFSFVYTFLIIIEVLPCCWFVNTLIYENGLLTEAIYGSLWYEQDQRFRKALLTFMLRSQKFSVIMAGNLFPVTLETFQAIIRFSFSMYTILSSLSIKDKSAGQ